MNGIMLALIALGIATIIAVALLGVIAWTLSARIKILSNDYAALAQKFAALREQNQHELLAIGQRVLEADKIVRRFSERLDGIENNQTSAPPQYGQLQELLTKAIAQDGEASAAEIELLSLLRQQRG
ncbi:MAG TPA: hypothetical protein VGK97_08270 [Spongiibacteraceae bacterium]|jgi:hypothetical protein